MAEAREPEALSMDNEQILRELLDKIAKERGFTNYKLDIKPTTSEGANFSSVLFLATISEQGKDDVNLFAKVACMSESVRAQAPYRVFETEIFFYTDLIKTYQSLEAEHNVPVEHRLVTPELYGINDEYFKETIVLDNLTAKGYVMFDRFKTMDWNYAKESLKQLAKLHALSMAYSIQRPESFEEKTKDLLMRSDLTGMRQVMAVTLVKIEESTKEEYKGRLKNYLEKITTPGAMEGMMKPMRRMVLAHGDYRPSNLMHKLNEDGTYDVIPIDYQTLNRNNPIVDLLYFLFNGSDKQFRADHYQRSLDQYYSELCAALERFHLNPDEVYPREDFEYELKEVLPLGLFISLMLLMMITVEVENTPKVGKTSELKDFYCTPSEEYRKRMNDLLEDCFDWGVL